MDSSFFWDTVYVYIFAQVPVCISVFSVIYRTQIIDKKETNHTCQIMSLVGKNDKKIASVEERAECEAGKLGQPHCNVSCEAVLGPKYKFCEEHRICENRKCSYAWGYTGRLNTSTS
jgi:hypothetical protein